MSIIVDSMLNLDWNAAMQGEEGQQASTQASLVPFLVQIWQARALALDSIYASCLPNLSYLILRHLEFAHFAQRRLPAKHSPCGIST